MALWSLNFGQTSGRRLRAQPRGKQALQEQYDTICLFTLLGVPGKANKNLQVCLEKASDNLWWEGTKASAGAGQFAAWWLSETKPKNSNTKHVENLKICLQAPMALTISTTFKSDQFFTSFTLSHKLRP